jgi:ribosomal protein S18 acetylase RimI-like enzyme
MEIAVRRLSQGDESTLVDIVRHHKARAIGLEYATQLLANPLNFLLVAEQHQHPVGFVWGYLLQPLDRDKHQLFVYEVDVSADARRQGVGTSLMHFIAAYTKEHSLIEAFVLTDSDNLAAQALYESTGATKAAVAMPHNLRYALCQQFEQPDSNAPAD